MANEDTSIDIGLRVKIEEGELQRLRQIIKDVEGEFKAWTNRLDETRQRIKSIRDTLKETENELKKIKQNSSVFINPAREQYQAQGMSTADANSKAIQDYNKRVAELEASIKSYGNELKIVRDEEKQLVEERRKSSAELDEQRTAYKEQAETIKKLKLEEREALNEEQEQAKEIAEFEKEQAAFDEARAKKRIERIEQEEQAERELLRQQETAYQEQVSRAQKQKELLNSIAQGARAVALVSTGLVTGAIALATKWSQKMEQDGTRTDISRRWINAMKDMEKSSMRIGAVLAERLVPYLEKAATFVERIANWVENNPDIVEAGVKGLAAIAVISTIVSTLLRIVTMLQTINLKGMMAGVGGTSAGGATASTASVVASSVLLIVAGIIASAAAVALVNQLLEKTGVNKKIDDAQSEIRSKGRMYPGMINDPEERKLQVELNKAIASGNTEAIKRLNSEIDKLGKTSESTAVSVSKTEAELKEIEATTKQFKNIMDNLTIANMEAEKQYKANVAQIIQGSNQRLLEIERQGRAALASLAAQNSKAEKAEKESLAKDLANLDNGYERQRADIIRSTGEDIVRIQRDTQEQLKKLEEEHLIRVEELTRSRDALGLAKEFSDYGRQKGDISEEGKKQIEERKRESAIQLAELKRSHDQQRSERIRAAAEQAALRKKAYAEQVAEINQQIAQEKAATLIQRQQMLAELARQYADERRKRYEAAAQQLRDINMSLVSERTLKNRYYSAMLADVNIFGQNFQKTLQAYMKTNTPTTKFGSGVQTGATAVSGSRAIGGYVTTDGIYRLAENNNREYVLSNQTTSAAEKLVGGQLTQVKLLAALQGGGTKSSITLNDNRRFDGNIPKSVRDEIREETLEDVGKILLKVGGRRSR